MVRKLITIGNSVGVTLDKKMLLSIGLDGATYVVIELDKKGKGIIVRERKENEW